MDRSWWWTGKPGALQSMGLQSQTWLSDWTELNRMQTLVICLDRKSSPAQIHQIYPVIYLLISTHLSIHPSIFITYPLLIKIYIFCVISLRILMKNWFYVIFIIIIDHQHQHFGEHLHVSVEKVISGGVTVT